MWVVFLSFLVGMVLRIADPEPDNAEKLYERLRARCKQHSHWLLLAALVLGLGALCFIYAPITGPLFKFGVLAWDVLTSLPAFGFGALIAYMTTDFILRHRSSEKAMIPGIMLGAGDLDCLTGNSEQYSRTLSIYYADTYLQASLKSLDIGWEDGSVIAASAKRIACDISMIRDTIRINTEKFRADSESEEFSLINNTDEISLERKLLIDEKRRERAEIIFIGNDTVRTIDRLISSVAGMSFSADVFSDLGFRRAYKRACAD